MNDAKETQLNNQIASLDHFHIASCFLPLQNAAHAQYVEYGFQFRDPQNCGCDLLSDVGNLAPL